MIGENIRRKRKEIGLTQEELASLLGYKSKSTIAKIESGGSDVSQRKLISFANVLNTTVEYLLTGIDKNANNKNIIAPRYDGEENFEKSRIAGNITAIVLAGGQSTRNGENVPNQFVNIKGKPVIIYVLETYQKHPAIDGIYVVCLQGWENIVEAYARNYGINKLKGIIPAGTTGALSVKSAIEWISSKTNYDDMVIFQESTRPMVTQEMISNVIRCTNEHSSAVTFEPMNEYLQFIKNETLGVEYIDRNRLIAFQSPEGYTFGKLYRAFSEATKIQHAFDETCCAMVMYNLGKKLVFCEGSRYNIKIVREEDRKLFEALLGLNDR